MNALVTLAVACIMIGAYTWLVLGRLELGVIGLLGLLVVSMGQGTSRWPPFIAWRQLSPDEQRWRAIWYSMALAIIASVLMVAGAEALLADESRLEQFASRMARPGTSTFVMGSLALHAVIVLWQRTTRRRDPRPHPRR